MNVSMQDAYNLGWKIALVVKGVAKQAILKTYESERRRIAQELIAFDHRFSRLFSARPAKDAADEAGISMAEFQQVFVRQQLFSSGFAVDYDASDLVAKGSSPAQTNPVCGGIYEPNTNNATRQTSQQHLATNIPLGKRFPSFQVVNQSDARPWHFARWLQASGCFHIVLFAGDVSDTDQMKRVHSFAYALENPASLLRRCTRTGEKIHSLVNFLTIHSAPRQSVELLDFPELLHPFDEEEGWDYNRIFVDEESYYEGHGQAYLGYGVDKGRGCVVVARPDQHVGWIGSMEDIGGLEAYFENILIVQ